MSASDDSRRTIARQIAAKLRTLAAEAQAKGNAVDLDRAARLTKAALVHEDAAGG